MTSLAHDFFLKLVDRVRTAFATPEEQNVASTMLKYVNVQETPGTPFPIHIDELIRAVGFGNKGNARVVIEHNFREGEDYVKQRDNDGKEEMYLNADTLKSICMMTKSERGKQARAYYIKLEKIYRQLIEEERAELHKKCSTVRETAILDHFPPNTQCVYWGTVDNISSEGESLIKFGNSNDLGQRVTDHRRTYNNFRLVSAFRVCNKLMIENVIKKDPQLKNRRRSIERDDGQRVTELLAVTDKTTGETVLAQTKLDEIFHSIIEEHEYNVDNYARVLIELEKVKDENVMLKEELRLWNEHKKNRADDAVITSITSRNSFSHVAPKAGLLIYAFKCQKDGNRYTCDICRPSDLEQRERLLKGAYPDGLMEHTVSVRTDFAVQVMNWLVRERFGKISQKVYEGTLEDIKQIFAVVAEFEKVVVGETCLQAALDCLRGNSTAKRSSDAVDPEIPTVRKAKRPVRQVHPESGRTVATFDNIEEAGRAMGTTGTAIGTALRNQRLSSGFRWHYADYSTEEQFQDQPVIKINCKTGVRVAFPSMNHAAKDAGISVPGLRNRILTDVHHRSTHWVFDRSATHYAGEMLPDEAATSDD